MERRIHHNSIKLEIRQNEKLDFVCNCATHLVSPISLPSPLTSGDTVTLKYTITNDGPEFADDIILNWGDSIDYIIAFQNFSCSNYPYYDQFRCDLNDLAVGSSQDVTMTWKVQDNVNSNKKVSIHAVLASDTPRLNWEDDKASFSLEINPSTSSGSDQYDLVLEVADINRGFEQPITTETPLQLGEVFSIIYRINNVGPGTVSDRIITITSDGLVIMPDSNPLCNFINDYSVTCTFGQQGPNPSGEFTPAHYGVNLHVIHELDSPTQTVTAHLSSSQLGETNLNNNDIPLTFNVEVDPTPNLDVWLTRYHEVDGDIARGMFAGNEYEIKFYVKNLNNAFQDFIITYVEGSDFSNKIELDASLAPGDSQNFNVVKKYDEPCFGDECNSNVYLTNKRYNNLDDLEKNSIDIYPITFLRVNHSLCERTNETENAWQINCDKYYDYVSSLPTPDPVDGNEVIIAKKSSVSGCEEISSCFIPYSILTSVGETITWNNVDGAVHTVTSGNPTDGPDDVFDSGLFMIGAPFSHTFNLEGTFQYYCMLHTWMVGEVVVGKVVGETSDSASNNPPSQPQELEIISSQGTDQNGNLVSSFSKGSLGFVKVLVSADKQIDSALITINLFDSEGTTLGVGSTKLPLNPGTSEVVETWA